MKNFFLKTGLVFLLVSLFMTNCQVEEIEIPSNQIDSKAPAQSRERQVIPGKYIVVLKDEAALSGKKDEIKGKALGLANKHGFNGNAIEFVYSHVVQGFSVELSQGQFKKLEADDVIAYIEQDQVVSLVEPFARPGGGGSTQPNQSTPWGITRVGGAGNGVGRRAWIIDTGIDLTHPDLTVDATKGFSAFTTGKDASFNDGNGHGSHVAGTIAAKNNTIGVIGVAAGATVVPVKVLNSRGSGAWSGVVAGVDHVVANGSAGDVANMSLGGPADTQLDNAILSAAGQTGVKFAIAAGNDGADVINYSPARINASNVYTISASDSNNALASFSNYGVSVDYAAPGVGILSTYKGGGYATLNGTSMATPHAAGVLLLGNPQTSGFITGDKDLNPDPIISR